jgi:hypothetical protein
MSATAWRLVPALAALVAAPLAFGADGAVAPATVDWNGATNFKAADSSWKIKLGAKLEAFAYYFDQDDTVNRDAVLREWATIVSAGNSQQVIAAASQRYAAANASWADGMSIDDAELGLTGSNGDVVFGLKVDFADASKNGTNNTRQIISEWYLGVQNIPVVGQLTFGYYDPKSYIGAGNFYDDDIADVFEANDIIGVEAKNSYMGGDLAYELRVGTVSDTAWGKKDGNFDLDLNLSYSGIKSEKFKLLLMGNLQYRNADTSGHALFSDGDSFSASYEQGPRLVGINFHADEVLVAQFSGDIVLGALGIGANYGVASSNVKQANDLKITDLLAGTAQYNEYKDGRFTTMMVYAGYTLTGEAQQHGGGIKAPKAPFSWEGNTWGAVDLVARYVRSDLQDDTREAIRLNVADGSVALSQAALNREEGGVVNELAGGLNWYLTQNMLFGGYYSKTSWEYAEGSVNDTTTLAQGIVVPSNPSNLSSLISYLQAATIANDYDADAFYFRGQVKF